MRVVRQAVSDAPRPAASAAAGDDGDRLLALDGVRGIAILLVLQGHLMEAGNRLFGGNARGIDHEVLNVASWGWVGVDLFFVLSGFLITGILFDAKSGDGYFRNFYARRLLRIAPLYYGYLLLVFIVLPLLPVLQWESPFRHQIWYWVYLPDIRAVALKGVFEYPFHGLVGHLWSLAIEEQFYLVWPAVVLAFSRGRLLGTCAACVIGSLVFRVVLIGFHIDGAANYTLLPGRMGSLAIGCAIALLARSERDVAWLGRLVIPLGAMSAAGLAVIIVVRHGLDAGDPWTQSAGYLLLGILFGAMVVGAVSGRTGPALDRLYRSAPLRMLGRYSYGLYVLEALTILFMSWLFAEVGDARLVLGSRLPEILAYCAATGVLTVVVAVASWHLYEQQFLKLKRHFPRSRAAPAADVRVLPSHVSGTAAATTPN